MNPRILIILVALTASTAAIACTATTSNTIRYSSGEPKIAYEFTRHEAGMLLHGPYTSWYENGQKKREGRYEMGKRQGPWTTWYENGQKKHEGRYDRDRPEGRWLFWLSDGATLADLQFPKDAPSKFEEIYMLDTGYAGDGLSAAELSMRVQEKAPQVQKCYERVLKEVDEPFELKFAVIWFVTPVGEGFGAHVVAAERSVPPMETCVAAAFNSAHFGDPGDEFISVYKSFVVCTPEPARRSEHCDRESRQSDR